MLTKKDLQQIAVLIKGGLKPIKQSLKTLKTDIGAVNNHNIRIENKLNDMNEKFVSNLFTWKSELFTKVDSVLGRLVTAEQENTVLKKNYHKRNS